LRPYNGKEPKKWAWAATEWARAALPADLLGR
jgi:hypothetical protein